MCSNSYTWASLHYKPWWQPWAQNSSFTRTFSMKKGGKIGHSWTINGGHSRNTWEHTGTLQVVSFLVFCVLGQEISRKCTLGALMPFLVHSCTPYDVISITMMPPCSRAHPHLHPIQVWSKLDQQFPRYSHFCVLPPCPFWSDHYQTI